MATPIVTILEEAQALLAGVAPSYTGEKDLLRHDAPRRYVWVLAGASTSGTRAPGGNPRSLHDDAWSVAVHCWGETLDEAVRLRQCLVTAVRRAVRGANYRMGQTTALSDGELSQHGHVLTVQLDIVTPLPEAALPQLADMVRPTVRPTTVDIDPGTPAAGDRNLDGPNEPANQ